MAEWQRPTDSVSLLSLVRNAEAAVYRAWERGATDTSRIERRIQSLRRAYHNALDCGQ